MIDLQTFCDAFGIEERTASTILKWSEGSAESPWYMRAFLALGAWLTAIAILGFFAGLIFAVLDIGEGFHIAMAVFGAISFLIGGSMHGKHSAGGFSVAFATALASAGAVMVAGGLGYGAKEIWVSVFISFFLALLTIAWLQTVIPQLLMSGLTLVLITIALKAERIPYYLDIAAPSLALGVLLWIWPPRLDVRATAFLLLMASPALSLFDRWSHTIAAVEPGGWGARGIHIVLLFWLVSILWRHLADRDSRIALGAFGAVATALCLALPPGAGGALVIMTMAFVLGSKPLALLGILLEAYFLWQFYFDLSITLLNKSMLLAAVGLAILGCWWLVVHRRPGRAGA